MGALGGNKVSESEDIGISIHNDDIQKPTLLFKAGRATGKGKLIGGTEAQLERRKWFGGLSTVWQPQNMKESWKVMSAMFSLHTKDEH